MIFNPHTYQTRAIAKIMSCPKAALFLDMGLGKTVSTLTAVRRLMDQWLVNKVLVIAPLSVAKNTWTSECRKWDHLQDMRVSVALGPEKKRIKALEEDADIYVTNRENTEWLCDYYKGDLSKVFAMIIIDESSSFKNHTAKRLKSLRKAAANVDRMVLLTGTPSPNGYTDLWAQYSLLDGGQRLGKNWTAFLATYFHPLYGNGRVTYKYGINPGAREVITDKVSDITLSMKASDYLELPDAVYLDYPVEFPGDLMKDYNDFKKDLVLNISEHQITAATAVALSGKLHQFTSGAVYDENHLGLEVHNEKVDALMALLEAADESNENVLVFYQFQHELPRIQNAIQQHFKKKICVKFFNGQPDVLNDWNKGKIRVLLAHPASVSYGLNMQQGGHVIVWFSLTWNLEQYQQANARLHRQGQTVPVRIYRLVVPGTVDDTISEALDGKKNLQDELLKMLKR